eukprot:TRINITY_DN12595_c0_g7_i1.p1 TRINITY_DN12595_c0_g7~~TRINITY_DN12595_c0_g7_i1.p1  ORF type:complete len:205 (-),score=48.86 TRINITY_DN12595_c0_g7_i1:163-777(-)
MLDFLRVYCCSEKRSNPVDTPKFRRLVERISQEFHEHLDDIVIEIFKKADKGENGKLSKSHVNKVFKEKMLPEIRDFQRFDFNGDGKYELAEFDAAVKLTLYENKQLAEVLVRQSGKAKGWAKEAWMCCMSPDDKQLPFTIFSELMTHTADIFDVKAGEEEEVRVEMKNLEIQNNDFFTQDEFSKLYLTLVTRMLFGKGDQDSY